MSNVTGTDDKAEARARARAQRRTAPPMDEMGLARNALAYLADLPGPLRTTSYASYGTEPATQALNAALGSAGYDVLLPRVVGETLEWVDSRGPWETSPMGIAEPSGPPVELLPIRALLIPALAVTIRGERLGKGGGFYDRTLATLPNGVPVAAIVRDEDIVSAVPTEAHDRSVDALITPTRILRTHFA